MKHLLFLFILLTLLGCAKGENVKKNYKEIFDTDIKSIFNTKSNISSKLEEYFEDRNYSYETWSEKEVEEEAKGLIPEDKLKTNDSVVFVIYHTEKKAYIITSYVAYIILNEKGELREILHDTFLLGP